MSTMISIVIINLLTCLFYLSVSLKSHRIKIKKGMGRGEKNIINCFIEYQPFKL